MTVQHTDVAAYSLGLLDSRDRAEFEAHLSQCDSCPAELAELSSMADLLAGIEPVEAGPGLDPAGLPVDELLRKRAAARRRQVWRQSLFAVAASLLLLAGGAAAGVAAGPRKTVSAPFAALVGQRHSATDPHTGVTGTVGLTAKAWGTQVTLQLGKVHGPLHCQLIAVSRSGQRTVVTGWFVPSPGYGVPSNPTDLLVVGGTSIQMSQIVQLNVEAANGQTLVSIPI